VYLTILAGVLKLFQLFGSYLEQKQMMDAGEAKVLTDVLANSLQRIESARDARALPDNDVVRRKLAQRLDEAKRSNPNTR
jgi:hypothetical protein